MQETPTTIGITGGDSRPDPRDTISFVAEVAFRYNISAIQPLIDVCECAAERMELNVAVLGRFKAGKSSFLNHFVDRNLLPVGVVPVTSIITELRFGSQEQAEVHFLDGRRERIQLDSIEEFVAESRNPANRKGVRAVRIDLPGLTACRGLHLIDTPGLESTLAHSTELSLAWLPNVDLALVAIGVDPSVSQQDIGLIRKLLEYTPKVCVLLTKLDVVSAGERDEVLQFVRMELNRSFATNIEVFPYSIRSGFQSLKSHLTEQFIEPALTAIREQKRASVSRKVHTLLRDCADYVQLTLRSAEVADAERQQLRDRIFGKEQLISDTKLELGLIARHAIGLARGHIEGTLAPVEKGIQLELAGLLEGEYPTWRMPFSRLLEAFDTWMHEALTSRLAPLSACHKAEFLKPILDVQRQYLRVLQAFRDRISAQVLEAFGVPVRTTETEIEPESPKAPDINIGRVFDHNWELLSPVIPMSLFRSAIKKRLHDRIDYEATKNLSRLTTQWADIVAATISSMQGVAERRIENLIQTLEHLTASPAARAPQIREDLDELRRIETAIQAQRQAAQ